MVNTENGAKAYELKNKCLEFFSKVGGMRHSSQIEKAQYFIDAASEDLKTAVKILFWARDARRGAGERKTFHDIVGKFIDVDFIARNAHALINIGYAKDLLPYMSNDKVLSAWSYILKGKDTGVRQELVAKWTPRRGPIFKAIRDRMAITNKELRMLLVKLSSTVEQSMSKKDWDDIEYSSVPGAAMRKYGKAFVRHDEERFNNWKLDKDSKASVSATYPHDVIKSAYSSEDWDLSQKLWDNLPQLKGDVNPIIMADTSGSMEGLPMLVSCSLGLFCSEQLPGKFNGKVLTFSRDPKFHDLTKFHRLEDKWNYLNGNMDWGYGTDFKKAYSLLLETGKFFNVSNKDMPKMVICISDMQFDRAEDGNSLYDSLKNAYKDAGYDFPKLVYWNVRASVGSPVDDLSNNVALISGFNPAVIKPLLNGDDFNPVKTMYDSINHIDLDFTYNPLKGMS